LLFVAEALKSISLITCTKNQMSTRSDSYSEPQVGAWLKSPAHVEALFAARAGAVIPCDYLERFERWLNSGEFLRGESWTDVMMAQVIVLPREQCVLLRKYIVRPWAQGNGFMHLFYLRILHYCHFHDLDLQIEQPTESTARFLETALPRHIVRKTEMYENGPIAYVKVPHAWMVSFMHVVRQGITKGKLLRAPADDDDIGPLPPIALRRDLFPSASAASVEPAASAEPG
jgi:hypothetical protein